MPLDLNIEKILKEFDDDDADTDNAPTISLARVMENDIP
jgi:hypothetical protein